MLFFSVSYIIVANYFSKRYESIPQGYVYVCVIISIVSQVTYLIKYSPPVFPVNSTLQYIIWPQEGKHDLGYRPIHGFPGDTCDKTRDFYSSLRCITIQLTCYSG